MIDGLALPDAAHGPRSAWRLGWSRPGRSHRPVHPGAVRAGFHDRRQRHPCRVRGCSRPFRVRPDRAVLVHRHDDRSRVGRDCVPRSAPASDSPAGTAACWPPSAATSPTSGWSVACSRSTTPSSSTTRCGSPRPGVASDHRRHRRLHRAFGAVLAATDAYNEVLATTMYRALSRQRVHRAGRDAGGVDPALGIRPRVRVRHRPSARRSATARGVRSHCPRSGVGSPDGSKRREARISQTPDAPPAGASQSLDPRHAPLRARVSLRDEGHECQREAPACWPATLQFAMGCPG